MINFNPQTDYGLLDMSQEDNLILWQFGELIKTLITLSSTAERQIEIIGWGVVTDEMAEDFYSYFSNIGEQYLNKKLIDNAVFDKIKKIDDFFRQKNYNENPNFWDDRELAINVDWQYIRIASKEILISMGFEKLDIDFEKTERIDVEGKIKIQTIKTRLINLDNKAT